jgi:dihydropyrimidinase
VKTLLKNGTVVSGDMSVREDVLIDGEKIVKVGQNLESEDARVVDVSGKLLFPGFIDGHTHFDLEVAGMILRQVQKLRLQAERRW